MEWQGNRSRSIERHQEALKAYEQATRLDPEYAQAWHNMTISLTLLRKYEEADQALLKAKKIRKKFM